jgi:hypothetical protein
MHPRNGYDLHHMIGNVWEWTSDWYTTRHPAEVAKASCIPTNHGASILQGQVIQPDLGPAEDAAADGEVHPVVCVHHDLSSRICWKAGRRLTTSLTDTPGRHQILQSL